jgi:hypothetical protein
MKDDIHIAAKIRSLKVSPGFTVTGEKERQKVCRLAKVMLDVGLVSFKVSTRADGKGGFRVAAF